MNWRGALLRKVNKGLLPFDLQIKRQGSDLDARLLSDAHRSRMIDRLADGIGPFLADELLFGPRVGIDCKAEIGRFHEEYLGLDQRSQGGGNRFTNLLWLYLIARVCEPQTIIESGTFRGLSAWALHKGAPEARLLTFDIAPYERIVALPEVRFFSTDWTEQPIDADPDKTLLFFDDHVDQAKRVREAAARGFHQLIFDDDASVESFASRTGHPGALPKIAFLFDQGLCDGEVIEWQSMGRRHYYRIDRAYLDQVRLLIRTAQRLPDLSWQLPTKAQLPLTLLQLEKTGQPSATAATSAGCILEQRS